MFNLEHILISGSYLAIFAIVFAESGLLIGLFLPGDSLLITAGLLAGAGQPLTLWGIILAAFAGAVLGDSTGYFIGNKVGPSVFKRPDSRFFKPEYVTRAQGYFEKYGTMTLIIARFVPIVRTIVPTMAGVGKMHYPLFFIYNVVGGALWSIGVTLAGFFLGKLIPNLDHYILFVVAAVLIISVLPIYLEFRKHRESANTVEANDAG